MISGLIGSNAASAQFLRFGMVGTAGYVIDTAVLYGVMAAAGLGPYAARVISFLVAATATWLMNRYFTFPDRHRAPIGRQWARFVLLMVAGGAINYGVYAALIASNLAVLSLPAVAVAAGSLSGWVVNFTVSRKYVFTQDDADGTGGTAAPRI